MVFHIKAVQLQDELTVLHQLFVEASAVSAAAPEQPLIPSAAGFDISNADQRLRTHSNRLTAKAGTFASSPRSISEMKYVVLMLFGAVSAAKAQPKFEAASIR